MCLNCNWERWYAKIENEILATSRYDFAEGTLTGIADWIEEHTDTSRRARWTLSRTSKNQSNDTEGRRQMGSDPGRLFGSYAEHSGWVYRHPFLGLME
jgi:hypothetical protein